MSCDPTVPCRRLGLVLALGLALFVAGCGDRAASRSGGARGDARPASADATAPAQAKPTATERPPDQPTRTDSVRTLRAAAARRCHSGSAQISTAGELRSSCTVDRGCTEERGKVSPSDGGLTLDCRGLTCTCSFEPRRDKAQRKRIQFAIDRPCGLSRGARAELLWLEHCFPLLPAGVAPPVP